MCSPSSMVLSGTIVAREHIATGLPKRPRNAELLTLKTTGDESESRHE